MRTIEELIDLAEPGWDLVQEWCREAKQSHELLEPSKSREDALLDLQVTTRSPMGAVLYETGGILIDHGWLRILGSGSTKLKRSLPSWNAGRSNGFLLVADDVSGGFFALNGGALGGKQGEVNYFSQDSLEWENLEIGYSQFLGWALSGDVNRFYQDLRWSNWKEEIKELGGDQCIHFYPPLFVDQGSPEESTRGVVSIDEIWDATHSRLEEVGTQN